VNNAALYDSIVVGAGHAGTEASLAIARAGFRVLLLTMNADSICQMSCNPAIGGLAKGHMVREIDALGGQMALTTDQTAIQFRMLNKSKGPAVWAPRAQADKHLYRALMKKIVLSEPMIDLRQDHVVELLVTAKAISAIWN
jgi:tRNA uridine 5-carboxymethylaminomethyl modification enzyme